MGSRGQSSAKKDIDYTAPSTSTEEGKKKKMKDTVNTTKTTRRRLITKNEK